MASSKAHDPNAFEFLQMSVFSLALAVTMVVFSFMEHGLSTHFLGFGTAAIFLLFALFGFYTSAQLYKAPVPAQE